MDSYEDNYIQRQGAPAMLSLSLYAIICEKYPFRTNLEGCYILLWAFEDELHPIIKRREIEIDLDEFKQTMLDRESRNESGSFDYFSQKYALTMQELYEYLMKHHGKSSFEGMVRRIIFSNYAVQRGLIYAIRNDRPDLFESYLLQECPKEFQMWAEEYGVPERERSRQVIYADEISDLNHAIRCSCKRDECVGLEESFAKVSDEHLEAAATWYANEIVRMLTSYNENRLQYPHGLQAEISSICEKPLNRDLYRLLFEEKGSVHNIIDFYKSAYAESKTIKKLTSDQWVYRPGLPLKNKQKEGKLREEFLGMAPYCKNEESFYGFVNHLGNLGIVPNEVATLSSLAYRLSGWNRPNDIITIKFQGVLANKNFAYIIKYVAENRRSKVLRKGESIGNKFQQAAAFVDVDGKKIEGSYAKSADPILKDLVKLYFGVEPDEKEASLKRFYK